jgi:hypothetical protein
MKAQTQTLSVVLIAAIVIAMIGLAYAWGMPLIQKRTTITEFSTAQNFILNLDSKITDIANSGAGEFVLDIPNGFVMALPYDASDPDNNSIIMEFMTDQPMIVNASRILIKTTSFGEVGVYGESEPRIITLTSQGFGTGHRMMIKLHYRELDAETRGYKIALNTVTQSGEKRIKVGFDRNVVQQGGASNGGDLILTYVRIEVT